MAFTQGDWDSLVGRSRVEIRSQTIIAKRTLVRAMINADSLKTNRQAMEDLMRLLLEELESGAAGKPYGTQGIPPLKTHE